MQKLSKAINAGDSLGCYVYIYSPCYALTPRLDRPSTTLGLIDNRIKERNMKTKLTPLQPTTRISCVASAPGESTADEMACRASF